MPQRPEPAARPDLAARWDEVSARRLRYITPEFTPVPGIERRARLRPGVTYDNNTWSCTRRRARRSGGSPVSGTSTTVETPTLIKIAYTGS